MYFFFFFIYSDYRPNPLLDRYDVGDLDESEYDLISQSDRVAAERFLEQRDVAEGRRRGDKDLLYGIIYLICMQI